MGVPMLRSLKAADCYAHANECGRNAETAFLKEMRDNFLRLQQIWLNLGRSYELAERLGPAANKINVSALSLTSKPL